MKETTNPKVWITYAWADDREGDFSYLVQELASADVEAEYDKVAIIPGRDLWNQIADKITESPIDGWAYLLTPNSLSRNACREELGYALARALESRGRDFPLIGLLHGVSFEDVPRALKIRLCVSLKSPNWKEEIKAGLQARPPKASSTAQTRYVWHVHEGYGEKQSLTTIEVRPRFEEIMDWRFAVPASVSVAQWGHGPIFDVNSISENPAASIVEHWGYGQSGGGRIADGKHNVAFSSDATLEDSIHGVTPVSLFGTGDRLSPDISAYVVLNGPLPDFVAFGPESGELEIRHF